MSGRKRLWLGLAVAGMLSGCAMPGKPAPAPGERFLVYFDEFSANISPLATQVIADAAGKAKATHAAAIRIEGHASATGSSQANLALVDTRTQAVADALQKQGLDPKTFKQINNGQTDSGDASVADRRVDIVLEK